MIDALKIVSWLVLVGSFLVVVLRSLIFGSPGEAVAIGIVAVICFIGWYQTLLWILGIRRKVRRHLGIATKKATLLEKDVSPDRLTDLRRCLERFCSKLDQLENADRLGANLTRGLIDIQEWDSEVQGLRYLTRETQPGNFEQYPSNAVYLLVHENVPFVARLHDSSNQLLSTTHVEDESETRPGQGESRFTLQVLAKRLDDAAAAVRVLQEQASLNSAYRGKMLLVQPRGTSGRHRIMVADRPSVDAGRIILPPAVLAVMRRSVESRVKFHGLLGRNGHSSKTGILLHGAPGTGKTLLTKHWIGLCESYTAIVPAGMEADTIRESFRLAAYLQPALIVIEDVDLLASRRESNANVTGLQELMNEMDGLAPSTEAIVLLSTNRPEVLEPALASRPGRVSQAIEFPLPDDDSRRRLLQMFAAAADTGAVHFDHWVERTAGSSPAFLEELVKKAIMFAAARLCLVSDQAPVVLTDEDFDHAIHELVVFGGVLTTKMLGFPESAQTEAIRSSGQP